MSQYHFAHIQKGKLMLDDKGLFERLTKLLPEGDCILTITMVNKKTVREWQQYYFALLGEISLHSGYSKDEIHQMVKDDLVSKLFKTDTTTDLELPEWKVLIWNLGLWSLEKFDFPI